MVYVLGTIGVVASFFLIKYRQQIGDMMGEAEWMRKVGGVYTFIVIIAAFLFFWSIAEMTGTTDIFLRPLLFLIPGAHRPSADSMMEGF